MREKHITKSPAEIPGQSRDHYVNVVFLRCLVVPKSSQGAERNW